MTRRNEILTGLLLAAAVSLVGCYNAQAKPLRHHKHHAIRFVPDANGNVVGGRPAGCPRQYCGCAASLYVFGVIKRDLNLAANWIRKFPRTHAAPGMVAARNHHVMVLMDHIGGDQWRVHDGNSGGGKTREHVRSIRGFVVVNPHAYAGL